MATKQAISIIEDGALASILASMETLSGAVNVPAVNVQAIYYRDPAYRRAQQLAALADWLNTVTAAVASQVGAVRVPVYVSPLDDMTVKELRAYAEARGIDVSGAAKKSDLILAIEAAQTVGEPQE